MTRMKPRLVALAAMMAAASAPVFALDYGVNIHTGSDSNTNAQRAAIMNQRGFKTARMDLYVGDQTAFRDQVTKIRAQGAVSYTHLTLPTILLV